MLRKARIFLIMAFIVIMMCTIPTALASEDYPDLSVDLSKDSRYNLAFEFRDIEVYTANDEDFHYLYVKSGTNITSAWFGNEDTDINISDTVHNTVMHSIRNNDTIELKASRDEFGNEIYIQVDEFALIFEADPFDPEDTNDMDFPGGKDESNNLSTNISLINLLLALIILSNLIWVFAFLIMKAKEKEYIEAYKLEKDEKGNETLTNQVEIIGEFKEQTFDNDRNLYIFEIRVGAKRMTLFSQKPFQEYKSHHLVKNYYWIRYLLLAYTYQKERETKVEIGYSFPARIYRFFCYLCNFTVPGMILTNSFFFIIFVQITQNILWGLLALPIGTAICLINYAIEKTVDLEKKEKTIEVETHIAPLESKYEIYDVYRVKGKRIEKEETTDQAKKPAWKEFIEEIKDYEKLYEMRKSELIKIDEVEIVNTDRRLRTPAEMRNLKRSYVARNREMTEEILEWKEKYELLKKKTMKLLKEKEFAKEEAIQEMEETLNEIDQYRKLRKGGIKQLFKDRFGSVTVDEDFGSELERAVNAFKKANKSNLEQKVDYLARLIVESKKNGKSAKEELGLVLDKMDDWGEEIGQKKK